MIEMKDNEQSLNPDLGRFQIASRVREIRLQRGMTQKQIADKIGCHVSHITRVEKGECNFKFETLSAIADALGCRLDFVEK